MIILYLYGAPATGKTTYGRKLAARLGYGFADLDEAIVKRSGRTIPEIFRDDGEAAFRLIECEALFEIIDGVEQNFVISLGGGTLLNEPIRRFCEKTGKVVCIDAPSEKELARRISKASGSRPLGNRAKERAAHYASFPNRIARFFDVGDSLVVVGTGFARKLVCGQYKVLDGNVAFNYGFDAIVASIPPGEKFKQFLTVMALWHSFAVSKIGRGDCVIAIGGGVTGDLTGFAAATWMRGIDWINVPTTLLAMVDASTGGKTGFDLPEGKNLAGAFHSPRLVLIDTEFLETLPPKVLADGRAEMIKHELIGGKTAKDVGGIPSASEIAESLAVKVGIVRKDPFEKTGLRLLLNCGHTVAHAVEKLTDYRVTHGEAVAIGCVEEARLACKMGLAPSDWPQEVAARFAAAKLPTELPEGIDFERMVPVMKMDKKRDGDSVTFALPCGWGDVRAVKVNL